MMLVDLPEVCFHQVSRFLDPPDLLNLLSTHSMIYRIGLGATLWRTLLDDDVEEDLPPNAPTAEVKQAYLRQSYCRLLPSVRWLPIRNSLQTPTAREGHLACRLGGHRIVLTGGYSSDRGIHVQEFYGHGWERVDSSSILPSFAYGASLTPIDNYRAIRFGGFQSGGYTAETSQLGLLELHGDRAQWTLMEPNYSLDMAPDVWRNFLARAYHTATLLDGRYLLVLGGMPQSLTIMNPVVLDIETWTWSMLPMAAGTEAPSPRFGHSTVVDERRNRLVVFGGGNGTDLLRSGCDNSEVWALEMAENKWSGEPWSWRLIHGDQHAVPDDHDDEMQVDSVTNVNRLSPAETLVLGRCHVGHKVSPDTALLLFGSGNPSTNGLLGYNLATDSFFRPHVQGALPPARFTCASVMLESSGYIFIHGGFSTQRSGAIDDVHVLDLAPGLNRHLAHVNHLARSNEPVTDEEALVRRRNNTVSFEQVVFSLLAEREEDRPAAARRMLEELPSVHMLSAFLHRMSTGALQLGETIHDWGDGEESDDDDSSYSE